MNFLIIIAAYLICHYSPWRELLHKDQWFFSLLQRVAIISGSAQDSDQGKRTELILLLCVAIPVIVLALLLWLLREQALLLFCLNLFILMYAVGRGEWRVELDALVSGFARGDTNIFQNDGENNDALIVVEAEKEKEKGGLEKGKLEKEKLEQQDGVESHVGILWRNASAQALYRELESYYAVFFWFFVLGAPAALFYRLLFLASRQSGQNKQRSSSLVIRLLWALEWLPVRLLTLLFGLAGNFETLLTAFRLLVSDKQVSSGQVLSQCAEAALFIDDVVNTEQQIVSSDNVIERVDDNALQKKAFQKYHRYSIEVKALLKRTEVAFLAFLSLIILLF